MDQPLCIPKNDLIKALEASMPLAFAGKLIGDLSGGLFNWKSLQNKRSLGLIPQNIFVRINKNVGVLRTPFLAWVAEQIDAQDAPNTPNTQPLKRPRGRPRKQPLPEPQATVQEA